MLIFSFDPQKNKKVMAGDYSPYDFTFRKKVNNRHYMILERGYGISEDVIEQLIPLDCKKIIINTKKTNYEFDFEKLLKQPVKNYGSGMQRFMKIKEK